MMENNRMTSDWKQWLTISQTLRRRLGKIPLEHQEIMDGIEFLDLDHQQLELLCRPS